MITPAGAQIRRFDGVNYKGVWAGATAFLQISIIFEG
jgi:hypothetical protein